MAIKTFINKPLRSTKPLVMCVLKEQRKVTGCNIQVQLGKKRK